MRDGRQREEVAGGKGRQDLDEDLGVSASVLSLGNGLSVIPHLEENINAIGVCLALPFQHPSAIGTCGRACCHEAKVDPARLDVSGTNPK